MNKPESGRPIKEILDDVYMEFRITGWWIRAIVLWLLVLTFVLVIK